MNITERKKLARQLILDAVQCEDTPTIDALKDRFFAEYGWDIKQRGIEKASIDWLQGLALHVPFYTCDIEAMGFDDGHEKNQYWAILAEALRWIIHEKPRGRGKILVKNVAQRAK